MHTTIALQAQTPQPKNFAAYNLTCKIIDAPNKHTATISMLVIKKNTSALCSCTAGNEGFKTKAAAAKVAQLIISKIKKGEILPTVTVEEMKKINATK